nr:hypothetical protein [Mammaliicoccus sp. Marseille-Q6498]
MIAEQIVKINSDSDLDAVYINFLNAPFNTDDELETEEIEEGIFRIYNQKKPFVTYRYTILDYSYNDRKHLENLIGINLSLIYNSFPIKKEQMIMVLKKNKTNKKK